MNRKAGGYLGIVASVLFIWLVLSQVNSGEVVQALQQADVSWLVIALICYWIELLLRILRWRRILVAVNSTIPYLLRSL